ncbi:MAG: caspase family protein [Bacteroidetes bacterium]|nr:caspase family protein [Bacteroidota bacterium]MBS1590506.1 caspase family protein [Bacteroidota bacterium]
MKKIFILLAAACIAAPLFAQKKIALVVAVGDYPQGGRWRNLSSMNDLKYVKAALEKNGFAEKNIDTLLNQTATKANIVKALDKLIERAGNGDIVYFQFSGHGQQIEDDNGDEADGYDEAIIPYDAKANYDPVTYQGQNHLRDDLLGEKLQQIRKKIGSKGSLLVLLDACYSGTATRGNEFAICRGESSAFQSPGYHPKVNIELKGSSGDEQGFLKLKGDNDANMVVISASSPNQMNYESKDINQIGVGSLSYAFAKAITNLHDGTDYATLFHKIKAQIQASIPTQVPMIEGDISQEVFSGKFIQREENFKIEKFSTNDSTFYINAGVLDNINNGNSFKILTTDNNLVAEGVVKQTGTFQSLCISNKPLNKAEAYIVKIDGVSYGSFSGSVFIKAITEKEKNSRATLLKKQIENNIKQYPFLTVTENADMMLDITKQTDGNYLISLVEKGDSIHYSKTFSPKDTLSADDWKYFMDGMKRIVRIKYFRNIADGGTYAGDVTLEVVPAKLNLGAGKEMMLKPNDQFSIKIINKGAQALYFTILDLLPNNDIKVLIPDESEEPQDYIIKPGETKLISGIQVDAVTPKGKEFFKGIFSKVPIDLRLVLNRKRTRSSTGQLQSFEKVVDDMFSENSTAVHTRSSISQVKVEEIGIVTAAFTIWY